LTKKCEHCGGEFKGMPSELARRRFCGQACAGQAAKGRRVQWVDLSCVACGKAFQVTPAWYKTGRRRYCSKACRVTRERAPSNLGNVHTPEARARMSEKATGRFLQEKSSQWKGGRFKSIGGYVSVMISTLPPEVQAMAAQMAHKSGKTSRYILEHRINAAVMLGRPLTAQEIVHHRNGVKDDNRPENLLVTSFAEHSIAHRDAEKELIALRQEVAALRAEVAALKSSRA
jgi:hypothetical protein